MNTPTGIASLLLAALAACNPYTTRPAVAPLPEAISVGLDLPASRSLQLFADSLAADSMPIARVVLRDGWLITPWFNAATYRPLTALHRPLGPGTVRVRAWADPTRPGHSSLTIETAYRPFADPSLPERELDRAVPADHPVGIRIETLLRHLAAVYGDSATMAPTPEVPVKTEP